MRKSKKILSVVLALVMLLCCTGISIYAEVGSERITDEFPFVTISDTHYYPKSLTGNGGEGCEAWFEYCAMNSKLFNESEEIIRTALDTIAARAQESGAKYVLIPGDLTKDSEYEAHVGLAKILQEYEDKTDLEFFVINGNHDVNTTKAATYENGYKETARAITPAEFPQVYANFGYNQATERYAYPENGDKVKGALSYVADLSDDVRLIVIDSCNYSFDEPAKDETGGSVTPELMRWVQKWADKSKEDGKTPFVMLHHGLAAHMKIEPSITFAFPLDDYMDVSEAFASWGIHYAFTGHLHTNDAACVINDDGEALYDFETASVTGYPNTYRENVLVKKANGETAVTSNAIDFDADAQITYNGKTYENGTFKYKAFDLCFGGATSANGKGSTTDFLVAVIKSYASSYVNQMAENGILPTLKSLGIDLEKILSDFLSPYIGSGIKIGSYNIFSVDNLMWFIEDLLDQISDEYLKDPEKLYTLIEDLVSSLMDLEVSSQPCTKFLASHGVGDASKPGTLGDAILCAMIYWYDGNEDISDDAFMQDTLDKLENGDTINKIFNKLLDLVIGDLVEDALLSKLEIRVDKLLADDEIQKRMGEGINYLLSYVLRGDFTYMNLVNIVFALGVLPYTSIYDTLDQLLIKKYLTDSQLESVGLFMAYVLRDFATDENPIIFGDSDVTYTSATVEVPVDSELTYRLPTMVSVTMGEDSKTQANINWYSKSTLEATDIEIYKADSEPTFKGVATENADFTITASSVLTETQYPGIDLGVAGFFWYHFDMMRHSISLSGLEPGATYYYRVGNEEYGWWSQTGKITTADGSDEVTFFHMTDPQAQNTRQYNRAWKNVLKTAFATYPEADFIINTGDLVDHGDNSKLWQYMFDCGADSLMNTFMMPVSGNHEGFGTNATALHFTLPNMPKQDTSNGVYYSFDYNNVHIAVLNTEALDENEALSGEQVEWLKKDISSSDAQWKFVALHKAIYSNGSHYADDDVCALRTQLSALMPQLGIDMVFQGHDHVYMRTASIVNNEKADTAVKYLELDGNIYKTQIQPAGTTYEIAGCSGVKSYITNDASSTDKYFPRAEKVFAVDLPMFTAIRIDGDLMYFDAYTVSENSATSVDRFAIQKSDRTLDNERTDYQEAEEELNESEALTFLETLLGYLIKIFKIVLNIYKIYIVGIELG